MKTWKIVVGVVVALGVVGGGWIKWREDQRVMRNARSAANFAQYDRPGDTDAQGIQYKIRDIEKCQDELRGTWFVSGSEKSELESKMAERLSKLQDAFGKEMSRRRG